MKYKTYVVMAMAVMLFVAGSVQAARYMENLDRGVVAVKVTTGVYVSWRMFGTEATSIGFNVYRGATKLNSSPITTSTNYSDASGTTSSTYSVAPVIGGVEQAKSAAVSVWAANYLTIPLSVPAGGTTPDGVAYTYSPNDCSTGDLDGDGQYEIVLKWDPSNSKDNSQSGYTGNVFLDAYKLNGTRLWRIDLGRNIRAGAHYTQFMVYDLDSDGKAEVVCKTADATKDGTGVIIGNANADYRDGGGYILSGPEYLTVFNGQTGAAMSTINYDPPRGNVSDWGDGYGNRVDRFLACVAYLDGVRPSVVMCRGYYTRAVLVAYDWRRGTLTKRWTFDSNNGYSSYMGQGNHNLSVGDVDGDGKDEIVYGACSIDHDGRGLYSTSLGHGDAMHFGKLNPSRAGLQVFQCHEGGSGVTFRDARTGAVIWQATAPGSDIGRACADDVTGSYAGVECWGNGFRTCTGTSISGTPSSTNFVTWWDGDLLRELLDSNRITKYGGSTLLTASNCSSNNSTKSTPCLSADILGDWREEVIFRTTANTALRIYTTTTTTSNRIYTLMHDPIYRLGIAWQNTAYNQPPHTGFFLGSGMTLPAPTPDIKAVGSDLGPLTPDPMTWALEPASTGLYSVTMTASAVSGVLDPEYYFACTSGGGHDSGWRASPTYSDAGLEPNMTYTYTVKARDWSNQANETVPSNAVAVTTTPLPPPAALAAYWPLSEASGAIVADVSGSGNNGVLEGAADPNIMWTEGKFANCLSFDGTGGRVHIPSSPTIDFGDESISISFWLKESSIMTPGARHEILMKGTLGSPADGGSGKRYEFYRKVDPAGNDYIHWVVDDNVSTSEAIVSSAFVCTGDWVHIIGIRDTTSNLLSLYVNGTVQGGAFDISGSISQDEPLYIGDSAMVGSIDDIRVYRHALSLPEITALYLGVWNVDNLPPSPDPMTFAIAPRAVGATAITMTATTSHDENAVEYFFANLTEPNHNSGWQHSTTYTDIGLANNATYSYRVSARDKSLGQNQTAWSNEANATTLRYECFDRPIFDLVTDCQVDFLDFAMLTSHWNELLPLTVDTLTNGTFDIDILPWQTMVLPSAIGNFVVSFDGTTGSPPGSVIIASDTDPDGTSGYWFYQIIPAIAGKQYKLSGEWTGDLSGSVAADPCNRGNWAEVKVAFESDADPNTWALWSNPSTVMYRKAFGSITQNIGPTGVWDWEQLTASPTNGPVEGIFTATGSYMIVAFGEGGLPASGVGYYYLDNLQVRRSPCPSVDSNGDCVLNVKDIAAFAWQWLTCNRNPAGECWK